MRQRQAKHKRELKKSLWLQCFQFKSQNENKEYAAVLSLSALVQKTIHFDIKFAACFCISNDTSSNAPILISL